MTSPLSARCARLIPLFVCAAAFLAAGCVSHATRVYGDVAVLQGSAISAKNLARHPANVAGKLGDEPVVVEGEVGQVSQARGSWFLLATPPGASPILVLLDEADFTMPRNAPGHGARILGRVETRTFNPGQDMAIGEVRLAPDPAVIPAEPVIVVVIHATAVAINDPIGLEVLAPKPKASN